MNGKKKSLLNSKVRPSKAGGSISNLTLGRGNRDSISSLGRARGQAHLNPARTPDAAGSSSSR